MTQEEKEVIIRVLVKDALAATMPTHLLHEVAADLSRKIAAALP